MLLQDETVCCRPREGGSTCLGWTPGWEAGSWSPSSTSLGPPLPVIRRYRWAALFPALSPSEPTFGPFHYDPFKCPFSPKLSLSPVLHVAISTRKEILKAEHENQHLAIVIQKAWLVQGMILNWPAPRAALSGWHLAQTLSQWADHPERKSLKECSSLCALDVVKGQVWDGGNGKRC